MTATAAATPTTTLAGVDAAGGRFQLTAWRPEDARELTTAVLASLEHLRPWMPWVQDGYTLAAAEEFVARSVTAREQGTTFNYRITRPDSDAVIGAVGLMGRVGTGALEIGYWVHSGAVRRGLATEASRLLTAAAFAVPGIERVEIHHDRANVASGAVPARLGYTLERSERCEIDAPGECGVRQIWVTRSPT
jgi:RimJ/RimL family protein N-acetyltransferase